VLLGCSSSTHKFQRPLVLRCRATVSQRRKVPLPNQCQATRSDSSQENQRQGNPSVLRRAQTVWLDDEVEDVDDDAEDKNERRKGEYQELYSAGADGDEEEYLACCLGMNQAGG
jgi:hypothetical protein